VRERLVESPFHYLWIKHLNLSLVAYASSVSLVLSLYHTMNIDLNVFWTDVCTQVNDEILILASVSWNLILVCLCLLIKLLSNAWGQILKSFIFRYKPSIFNCLAHLVKDPFIGIRVNCVFICPTGKSIFDFADWFQVYHFHLVQDLLDENLLFVVFVCNGTMI